MADALPPRELRRAYDRSASGYDERFAALQGVKYEALLARFSPGAGSRVLDLGCGTGLLVPRLPDGLESIVGLDASGGMLALVPRSVRRVQADALSLPFCAGAFDVVFAVTSLLLTPRHLARAVGEVARVLEPGGVLAVTLLERDAPPGMASDLAAAGFVPGPRFDCGQDVGWIAQRV